MSLRYVAIEEDALLEVEDLPKLLIEDPEMLDAVCEHLHMEGPNVVVTTKLALACGLMFSLRQLIYRALLRYIPVKAYTVGEFEKALDVARDPLCKFLFSNAHTPLTDTPDVMLKEILFAVACYPAPKGSPRLARLAKAALALLEEEVTNLLKNGVDEYWLRVLYNETHPEFGDESPRE